MASPPGRHSRWSDCGHEGRVQQIFLNLAQRRSLLLLGIASCVDILLEVAEGHYLPSLSR
jgi:hypothetical protein